VIAGTFRGLHPPGVWPRLFYFERSTESRSVCGPSPPEVLGFPGVFFFFFSFFFFFFFFSAAGCPGGDKACITLRTRRPRPPAAAPSGVADQKRRRLRVACIAIESPTDESGLDRGPPAMRGSPCRSSVDESSPAFGQLVEPRVAGDNLAAERGRGRRARSAEPTNVSRPVRQFTLFNKKNGRPSSPGKQPSGPTARGAGSPGKKNESLCR